MVNIGSPDAYRKKNPGRGTVENPINRFERFHIELDQKELNAKPDTQYLTDPSRSIIAKNNSPDVGFDYSINPYRGCEHGCIYCYARPTHEYLGFSSGLDFETKILVKTEAPLLLREELNSKKWRSEPIAVCGITDPYQPIERHLKLTRRCLAVLSEFRNPVVIVTKNFLITRDLDYLKELAAFGGVVVNISLTSLDPNVHRVMEPRTSPPLKRLEAIGMLSSNGIPVNVYVAPVIPGLTDYEVPKILKAARNAGAVSSSFMFLRLPHSVQDLFLDWLERHFPERRNRVINRLKEIRGGELSDPRFYWRMRGTGKYAQHVSSLFNASCRKFGLKNELPRLNKDAFRRPGPQLELFE